MTGTNPVRANPIVIRSAKSFANCQQPPQCRSLGVQIHFPDCSHFTAGYIDEMDSNISTIFLPGAGGSAEFWKPVADRTELPGIFIGWPGLGNEPHDPNVAGIDDLVGLVLNQMDKPVNIVAQSMGGVVAVKVALAAPKMVNRLVLAVTSGGLPVAELGGSNWRSNYRKSFPQAANWIAEPVADLSNQIRTIESPTLLLWGDNDPISPVAVGQRLETLFPYAKLNVLGGADHDLALTHTEFVAEIIQQHLMAA
jgi:pimeloyl-ACP methyl ester carboxylesterase